MPDMRRFHRLSRGAVFYLTVSTCALAQDATWQDLELPGAGHVMALHAGREGLLAGTLKGRIYRSTDDGGNWRPVFGGTGLPINAFLASDSTLLAAAGWPGDRGLADCPGGCRFTDTAGLFLSGDGGVTWSATGLTETTALARRGTATYAATHAALHRSLDGGRTWKVLASAPAASSPFRPPFGSQTIRALRFVEDGNFAMGGFGAVRLILRGDSAYWQEVEPGRLVPATAFAAWGGHALVATRDSGLLRSSQAGAWTRINPLAFWSLHEDGERLLGIRDGMMGVMESRDGGVSWTELAFSRVGNFRAFCSRGDALYGGLDDRGVFAYRSSQWTAASRGISEFPILALALTGNGVLASRASDGEAAHPMELPSLANREWMPAGLQGRLAAAVSRADADYAALGNSLMSRPSGAGPGSWRALCQLAGGPISGLAAGPGWVAAYEGLDGALAICEVGSGGQSDCSIRSNPGLPLRNPLPFWIPGTAPPKSPHPDLPERRLAASGDTLVFVRDTLYLSTDRGRTWARRGTLPCRPQVVALHGGRIHLGGWIDSATGRRPALHSTGDGGATWRKDAEALPGRWAVTDLSFRDGAAFAATDSGVYRMRAGGEAWDGLGPGPPIRMVTALAVKGDVLAAGLEEGQVVILPLESSALRRGKVTSEHAAGPLRVGTRFRAGEGAWRRLDGKAQSAPR